MPPTITIATLLIRGRAQMQQRARRRVRTLINPRPAGQPPDPLRQIANAVSRYAQTQPTVYDTSSTGTPAVAGVSLLERQVDRAITQVLGRGTGRGSSGFINALNATFPTGSDGQVQFAPARTALVLSTPQDGYPGVNGISKPIPQIAAGLAGQLSAEQATLYRETSVVATDALSVLAGLQPFVPEAETDKVEALRALVRSQINTLMDEFGRVEEPRPDRVDSYLAALRGPNGSLAEFGRRAFLDRGITPVTPADEAMLAGFQLVQEYVRLIETAWKSYYDARTGTKSLRFPEFTLRLQRASVMLPVLAEGNVNFMQAMDSVGFGERERRSQAARFTGLGPGAPDITVADLTDELDRLANVDGPVYLADSGEYGLSLLADQAHRLFMLLGPVVALIPSFGSPNLNSLPLVAQVLAHERVNWSVQDLFNQLDTLADQAA